MRVLLGMSGGLDSTYAALKLLREGHEVEGAVLLMHDYTEIGEAQAAADSVGIPLHIIDCKEAFDSIVVSDFIENYKKARTPNPCIVCNCKIKFRELQKYAVEYGFDAIATGHYAKVVKLEDNGNERFSLACGDDESKDQTYMLYRLPQSILSMLLFPLGEDKKSDVRIQARSEGLTVADRPESQEICFIPDGDYASFIEDRTEVCPEGDFIDESGKVLGRHKGIIRYTVGQRRGLGISAATRIFVTKIDVENNTVTLSATDKIYKTLSVSDIIFSGMAAPKEPVSLRVHVKLRYKAPKASAVAIFYPDGRAEVILDEPARAVTPGQSAVFYDGNVVLAGGFID